MPFATRMTRRRVTSTSCKLKLIFSAYTDQAIDQGYRAVQELLIELTPKDLSGLPVVTKDCGNSVLDFAFGIIPTNANRVCGVPQPSAFQKLERHFLEFSGDIACYSFLPRFWRAPDRGLTVAQIVAQERAYAAQ
jgi:hypothetical protein